jgi:phospholipase/carboxylesterase
MSSQTSSSFQLEPPIEIETGPNPTLSVIWMHGLGADGNDFVPVVPELKLPKTTAVRFIFPHAPMMPVTCNNGYVMRAWFDILSMAGGKRDINEATIIETVGLVRGLISRENARGIPSNRIVLAGFSQGGAMAYTVGLTHPETLGGMVALSGYMPAPQWVESNFQEANRSTPIFAAHGTQDDVLPIQLGITARDLAQKLNTSVEWHTWGMPHTVCLEEIILLGEWLGHVAG